NDFANSSGTRIRLIDSTGKAWLDSTGEVPSGDLLAFSEVAAARDGRIVHTERDDENGVLSAYAAAPILDDDHLLAIVQISAPVTAAQTQIWQRWLALGGGVVGLTVLAIGISLWLSASLIRPLSQLRKSALNMAAGDLTQRIPENRADEIGELATAFNHMAGQVEAMLAEQRAFASNTSHELRTPLTAIRLRSEALRDGEVRGETAQQYIVEIDDEVKRMGHLVEDLILLSRLEAGRAQQGQAQIDMTQFAHSLINGYAAKAAQQGIDLTLYVPQALPTVAASLTHLNIVFRNLLDNGMKYTPDGGAIICKFEVEDGHVHVTITDDGQGIAAEDLPHLFERFYRADKARTRAVDGVGLGLSLVQTIVNLYNGRLSISSPGIGKGTVAQVWWPITHLIDTV
ncbi:MAG: HAMP domain-containing protein, partial [Chloroflexi bacterium]|nr:HAMP domain-containing protein [Chloroflexota bacterium]